MPLTEYSVCTVYSQTISRGASEREVSGRDAGGKLAIPPSRCGALRMLGFLIGRSPTKWIAECRVVVMHKWTEVLGLDESYIVWSVLRASYLKINQWQAKSMWA